MANALTLGFSLTYTGTGTSPRISTLACGPTSIAVVPSGNGFVKSVISVGTADETLALGDVATNGYLWLHNLDGTNYITFGPDGSSYPVKLKAGEIALLRWNGAAIHAKANTAACQLEYALIED